MYGIIYILINKINNKVYIGQSIEFQKRMNAHSMSKFKDKIHNSIMSRANLDRENGMCTTAFIKCLISIIEELNFNLKDIQKFQNNNIKILYFLNKYVRNSNIMQYLIFDVNEEFSNERLIARE